MVHFFFFGSWCRIPNKYFSSIACFGAKEWLVYLLVSTKKKKKKKKTEIVLKRKDGEGEVSWNGMQELDKNDF